MRTNKLSIEWLRRIYFSNIVNEVIMTISNFWKKPKINSFPPLRSFKNLLSSFFFCWLVFVLLVGFGLICVFVRLKRFRRKKWLVIALITSRAILLLFVYSNKNNIKTFWYYSHNILIKHLQILTSTHQKWISKLSVLNFELDKAW